MADLLTTKEAAALVGCSAQTIRNQLKGKGVTTMAQSTPSSRGEALTKWKREDVEDFRAGFTVRRAKKANDAELKAAAKKKRKRQPRRQAAKKALLGHDGPQSLPPGKTIGDMIKENEKAMAATATIAPMLEKLSESERDNTMGRLRFLCDLWDRQGR